MILNIPTKFNRFPVYTGGANPPASLSTIPLTFAPISSATSITMFKTGNTEKYFKYNLNNTGWQDYTFETEIPLALGDSVAFSGDSTPFYDQNVEDGTQTVSFTFKGTSNGQLKAYGNLHSLMNYGTLSYRCFRNVFRSQEYISDYSRVWLPLPDGYSVNGLYGSGWRQDNYVKKLPRFRMTDFTNMPEETLNATGYSSNNISAVEVCWTEWVSNPLNYFLAGAGSNVQQKIFIKPPELTSDLPYGWIYLNRMSDGSLQFAEAATWDGNSYSAGDSFPGEDPYADFY